MLKQLPMWVKVAAFLVITYLAIFQIPILSIKLQYLWQAISLGHTGITFILLMTVTDLLIPVAGIIIWLLSVYLAGVGLFFTKKKAYAFLLAFFLLCTVTMPFTYTFQKVAYNNFQRQIQQLPADQLAELSKYPVREPTIAMYGLQFSIGSTLLLLAVWFMCKADGIKIPLGQRNKGGK